MSRQLDDPAALVSVKKRASLKLEAEKSVATAATRKHDVSFIQPIALSLYRSAVVVGIYVI